ncbi:MAG: class II aldolase/adducin family protein [Gammaproteobacteria bacterium]|jgi:L-ribulose-5-phosphate 4-epimerase
MTMTDEGYIKYRCIRIEGDPPSPESVHVLNAYRQHMHTLGLIGHSSELNVDFGNISIRAPLPAQMIISGTQTGHLTTLSAEHYCLITDADIEQNRVIYQGKIKPSSETLTHVAIYDLSAEIHGVIHVHAQAQWQRLLYKIPTTAPDVAYGTSEMAREFQRLYRESELSEMGIAAMHGHAAGIISFGNDLEQAEQRLLKHLGVQAQNVSMP